MRVEEIMFWTIIMGIVIVPHIVTSMWKHRHHNYGKHTQTRIIKEYETYERWDDNTQIMSEKRERVQNADYIRAERGNDRKPSPLERVKSMGGN